jgi:hypothetical protein
VDGFGIEMVGILYAGLECTSAIWFILWPFGTLVTVWYIFTIFGILCQKNLATLALLQSYLSTGLL